MARRHVRSIATLLFAAGLTVIVLIARQQMLRMDWVFFQPSWSGIRGLVHYMLGDYDGAARAYRAHFRERVAAGETLGDAMLDGVLGGDLAGAERAAKTVLARGWSPHAALTLGEVALHRGHPGDAATSFRRVLDQDPDNIDALVLISIAHTRQGDHGGAIAALNRALRRGIGIRMTSLLWVLEATGELERVPSDRRPWCLLALDYRYLRVFDPANSRRAIASAKQAIARGDRPAHAYLTLGVVHEKQGRRDEALRALQQAFRHDPGLADAYWWAALISAERGDLGYAYRMIRAAFDAAPADPFYLDDVHRIVAYRLGDLPTVVEIMGRAVAASPDNVRAHRHLAYASAVLGDEPQALGHYRRAIELAPGDPTNWEGFGWALGRLGRHEDSISAYRRATSLDPRRYEPHQALARLYEHRRRYRDAALEYETALRLGDPRTNTLLSLCVARYNLSEFDRAAACFRAVLARDPGHPAAQRFLPQTEHNARLQRGR